MIKASAGELLGRLPGPPSPAWPEGARFLRAFTHGSMSVEFYAPVGRDPQSPHAQDELYVIHCGRGEFVLAGERVHCGLGDVLFAPAGTEHCFENFSPDFCTWVIFWGPRGGESAPDRTEA